MSEPVLVCGLGRCGSSVTMQMLQAGGYQTFGDWPDFEPEEAGSSRNIPHLLSLIDTSAVKILDPHISNVAGSVCRSGDLA